MFSIRSARWTSAARTLCGALWIVASVACAPSASAIEGTLATALSTPAQAGTFDHSAFDALLAKHVRDGRVDYEGLRAEKSSLLAYTKRLAAADLSSLTRGERLALLINAYNALTLQLMLEPDTLPASIRDLPSPWKTVRWTVGGQQVSLDNLEHGLIRPLFNDPRIHFAVNCASGGCPPLASSAFTGAAIDQQLDAVTQTALRNPAYAKVEGGKLHLTKILDWYGKDMTAPKAKGRAATVPAWVARYSTPEVAAFVATHDGAPPVVFQAYDWKVNAVR